MINQEKSFLFKDLIKKNDLVLTRDAVYDIVPNGNAGVAELADATDLKSVDTMYRVGSIPTLGTMKLTTIPDLK